MLYSVTRKNNSLASKLSAVSPRGIQIINRDPVVTFSKHFKPTGWALESFAVIQPTTVVGREVSDLENGRSRFKSDVS